MTRTTFEILAAALGIAFAVAFCIIVVPPLLESGDIVGALAAGFVNPYASGYSLDTIVCGLILIVWVIYERSALGIRHGWIAIPVSFVPGVATAFGLYLLIRSRQLAARAA
jgi:Terpene cyclase DEP1